MDEKHTGKELQRWSDEAMFQAEPVDNTGPKVTLLSMTVNPLRVIAAAANLYSGKVTRDLGLITRDEAEEQFASVMRTSTKAPLEFVHLDFLIENVTRGFTHQLVRQRTAVYVQESMRFAVKTDNAFGVALPPSLMGTTGKETQGAELSTEEWQRNVWDECVSHIEQAYLHLIGSGMPAEDARGLLPTNILTRVHYCTSLRGLLEHSGMRLCSQAQFEWKQVWAGIIRAIRPKYLFSDPASEEDESWQREAIARIFKPVCYQTGKCEFLGLDDRYCVIRDRVINHTLHGDLPSEWDDIDPGETLSPTAARRSR